MSQTLSSRLNVGVANLATSTSSGLVGGTSAAQTLAPTITLAQQLTASNGVLYGGGGTQTVLNWYEEGTWTPIITTDTGTNGTYGYTTQSGYFTRIGRMVYVTASVLLSSYNGAGTGRINIGQLPYTAHNDANLLPTFSCWVSDVAFTSGYQSVIGQALPNTTNIRLLQQLASTTIATTTVGTIPLINMGTTFQVACSGFYFI